jgi:hypothetical protein
MRESYINSVMRKNFSVHSIVVTWFCNAMVLTSSSSAYRKHLPSSTSPEKEF